MPLCQGQVVLVTSSAAGFPMVRNPSRTCCILYALPEFESFGVPSFGVPSIHRTWEPWTCCDKTGTLTMDEVGGAARDCPEGLNAQRGGQESYTPFVQECYSRL